MIDEFLTFFLAGKILQKWYDFFFNEKIHATCIKLKNLLIFLIKGHETTASSLGFFFLEISRHPEIFKKIRKEIDDVIGSRSFVLFEDLNKLEYTFCAFSKNLKFFKNQK